MDSAALVYRRLQVFPENNIIIIGIQFLLEFIIFRCTQFIPKLFQIKCELLSGTWLVFLRFFTVLYLFAQIDFSIEANQFTAFVWIKMAFGIFTNVDVIANHCSAVVTARNTD